ncbi:MAG: hypothetical protein PHQ81_10010, partial [Methanofollis sp.]|nr:hypothetical protein [Methanofollis sp.]
MPVARPDRCHSVAVRPNAMQTPRAGPRFLALSPGPPHHTVSMSPPAARHVRPARCGGELMPDWTPIMDEACRFFEQHLTDERRAFLLARYGLRPGFVERARIGYAPASEDGLLLHLMERGYAGDEIVGSGLVQRWKRVDRVGVTDLFRGRIIFPYLDGERNPLYFIGRQTDETPQYGERIPAKYKKQVVTPDGPREPIFGSWSVVPDEPLIISEWVADALATLQD